MRAWAQFSVAALAVMACSKDVPTSSMLQAIQLREGARIESEADSADPGVRMRLALRQQTPDDAIREIERGRNLVIVGFRSPGASAGVDRRGRSLVPPQLLKGYLANASSGAVRVIHQFKTIPAVALEFAAPGAAEALRHQPWVDYVAPASAQMTPDAVACFSGANNDPPSPGNPDDPQVVPWQAQRIGADTVWATGITGTSAFNQDLIIYGDGIQAGQSPPSLQTGPELYTAIHNWYVAQSTTGDGWHETAVAGTAAARDNTVGMIGIAPDARVRSDKIVDNRVGGVTFDFWLPIAIDNEAASAWVMNLSYSHKTTSSSAPGNFVPILDAIRSAYYNHNVVFISSTGNEESASTYTFPAAWGEVVGVGGSSGIDTWIFNDYAPGNVEISAPAAGVLTVCQGGRTGFASGTSFAAPVVAGAFMLLKQAHPTESADRLRQRVALTAKPMTGGVNKVGAGLIKVRAAIALADPPTAVISGPSSVRQGSTCEYNASSSSGSGTLQYQWYQDGWQFSNAMYTSATFTGPSVIGLRVTDSHGQFSYVEQTITISPSAPVCLF